MNTILTLWLLVALTTLCVPYKATPTETEERVKRFAAAYAFEHEYYVGVSGNIAVWQPRVAEDGELSINVVGCVADGITIYAGYAVSPKHFKDDKSRLFLGTSIRGRNCYNNANCSGFVRVDFTRDLGDILDVSDYDDPSKHRVLEVTIRRNDTSLAWWVDFDSTPLGYIRSTMLPGMVCESVMWGGVVVTPDNPNITEMGNGHFPIEGPLKTGEITYARSIPLGEGSQNEEKRIDVTSPEYYDFQILDGGDHFLYGGPGNRDPN